MLHTFCDNACLIVGSILAYLCASDPHGDFAQEDRVRIERHMVSVLSVAKLQKYAFGCIVLAELYLNLNPQLPRSYLFPLPQILQRLFPSFFSIRESSLITSDLRPFILFIFLASGALRVWAMYTLGRLFTFTLSIRKGHRLVTGGPYAYVRHPSYTGAYGLIASGAFIIATSDFMERAAGLRTAIIHTSWLGLLSVIVVASTCVFTCHQCFLGPRVENEEEMLEGEFGKEWKLYRREVPYRILPFIW